MQKDCEVCGVSFNASKSRVRTCSVACGGILRRKDLAVERACEVCGTLYSANATRLSFGRETTCSRECSYRLRADKNDCSLTLVCGVCASQFRRPPSAVDVKHGEVYCGAACLLVARNTARIPRTVSKPYQYSESAIRKIRVAGALAYAAGKTLSFPEYELAVARLLEVRGISFIHQYVIEHDTGAIVVDFLLTDIGVVVELDGPEHRISPEKDRERDELISSEGLTIIRIAFDVVEMQQICDAVVLTLFG